MSPVYESQTVYAAQEKKEHPVGKSAESSILRLVVRIVTSGFQGHKTENKHHFVADFHQSLNWIFKDLKEQLVPHLQC
jgi:hypothetical protein